MPRHPYPALPPEHNVPAFPPCEAPRGGKAAVHPAQEPFLPPRSAARLDAALLALLLAVCGWALWFAPARLDYDWNWGLVAQYLVRHEPLLGWTPGALAQGLGITLRLGVWSTLLALCIGTGMGLLRASPNLFRRMVARTYVEGVRNLPPLVLVFIFHFFVSAQLAPVLDAVTGPLVGVSTRVLPPAVLQWLATASAWLLAPPDQLPVFLSGVVTLGVYEGAYVTEIVRAGLQGVDKGQWEAAASTGLGRWQQLRRVILPQALRLVVPPLAGQFISTIKDSAILSVISIRELTFQGMELMAATYLTFEIWLTVAALYLLLTLSCSAAARHVERRVRLAM